MRILRDWEYVWGDHDGGGNGAGRSGGAPGFAEFVVKREDLLHRNVVGSSGDGVGGGRVVIFRIRTVKSRRICIFIARGRWGRTRTAKTKSSAGHEGVRDYRYDAIYSTEDSHGGGREDVRKRSLNFSGWGIRGADGRYRTHRLRRRRRG